MLRCTKRVGDDDLCAKADVVLMNPANDVRMTERRTAVPSVLKLRDTPHLAFGAGSTVDHDSLATVHPRNEALVSVRCGHFSRAKQVISTRLPPKSLEDSVVVRAGYLPSTKRDDRPRP